MHGVLSARPPTNKDDVVMATTASDSPQFSTLNARFAPREFVGSALTIVTCIGFSLTIASIEMVSVLAGSVPTEFLPLFEPNHPVFRATEPIAQGVAVLDPAAYSYFRYQVHRALENALSVYNETAADFPCAVP